MLNTPENNDLFKPVADVLFAYLRDMIYDPANASLDVDSLPESFDDVAKGLKYLNSVITETKDLANELAAGNLNCPLPPSTNEIASPLKKLSSSLKHLTWQAQLVAKGNYNQQVDFMGDFSDAFNDMIMQLKQRSQESTDEKDRLKGFLAKVSHEIRTPMNAILGIAELSLREEMSDTVREQILTIKHVGINLLSIINDILDFSKIESGQLELASTEYSLSGLINDTINIIKTRLMDSNLRFIVHVDANIPAVLNGDSTRIRQVMLNLLSNAVKYTREGYVSFIISGKPIDERCILLTFSVEDSGIGISKENINTLFTEFTQFDPEQNTGIEGTGLGLAITKNLVEVMSGEIQVESEYGKGSTFTVTIPQQIVCHDSVAHVKNSDDQKVLIFERREVCLNSIIRAMNDLNIQFKCVSSPSEFYNELKNGKYSVAFLADALYKRVSKRYEEFKTNTMIVLIAEFDEVVPAKNISVLTTPIFTIPLANILNGVSDNYTRTFQTKYEVAFTAPDAKILVVDDNNTNLIIAKGFMDIYEMQIDVCTGGAKAIDLLRKSHYDLIFMDHMMPEPNGIETVKLIRSMAIDDQYFADVPIIAFTANAISGTKEMFIKNGFQDYISKPISALELNTILEKWIPLNMQITMQKSKTGLSGHDIEIEGIDVTEGIYLTGGSIDIYNSILPVYLEDVQNHLKEINNCLNNNNIKLFTTHIHAIKGSSTYIGADKLSSLAEALENAGLRMDTDYINANINMFFENQKTLFMNIEEYLSSIKSVNNPKQAPFDPASVLAELTLLKTAFNDFDVSMISEITSSLQTYAHIPEIGSDIEKILYHKISGEYDEAVFVIDKIVETISSCRI